MTLQPDDLGVEPGGPLKWFSAQETRGLAERWLQCFGTSGGVNTKAYLWHALSAAGDACASGDAARTEYEKQVAPSFIVMANDRTCAVEMAHRPVRCRLSDWFVFPPNFAWTMAFTHEDGWIGPLFGRHAEGARLDRENLAALGKQRAIAVARSKGWL